MTTAIGSPDSTALDCEQPTGFVANGEDCDDTFAGINPLTTWYQDDDLDTYGNTSITMVGCANPDTNGSEVAPNWVLNDSDCNDSSASNSPPPTPSYVAGPTIVYDGNRSVTYETNDLMAAATGYTWSVPTGATITTGADTPSVTVDFDGSSSGDVTVYASNSCGDSGTSSLTVTVNADTEVTFPDPNLESCVRTAIGRPAPAPIQASFLTPLTVLGCNLQGISNISGIEYAVNLQQIGFSQNSISDLTPLASLTQLRSLFLDRNSINDLSPLAGLTTLSELWLWDNGITDISALSGLTNMRVLNLWANMVSDLSPLSGMTLLLSLYLDINAISDISLLSGLARLEELSLSNNNIADIASFAASFTCDASPTVHLLSNPLDSGDCVDLNALETAGCTVDHEVTGC